MKGNVIDAAMQRAVDDDVFPAGELLVAKEGNVVHHGHYGASRSGILYDISSLTKPIATATLTMSLVAEDLLKPADTVYQWLAGARLPAHRTMTVAMLLKHTSGLPAWQPYYRDLPLSLIGTEAGRQMILDSCFTEGIEAEPGTHTRYSDIGYIILGRIIEEAGSAPLDTLFANRVARPLELRDTFFVHVKGMAAFKTPLLCKEGPGEVDHKDLPHLTSPYKGEETRARRRFAPTEDCPWRERVVKGEVHDQNAYALGGVAGHAGLFSTADDIHRFLSAFTQLYDGKGDWLPPKTVQELLDFSQVKKRNGDVYLGGWNLPSIKNSSAGHLFSKHTIGHLGYTGCSMWVDLECHAWVILLTNRIHPSTTNEKIKAFRPKIHDLVFNFLPKITT